MGGGDGKGWEMGDGRVDGGRAGVWYLESAAAAAVACRAMVNGVGGKKNALKVHSSIWREEILEKIIVLAALW